MQDRPDPSIRAARPRRERSARVRLGSYEFEKKGISRFDLRDPYHLAIALTWPQFLAALFALYSGVNLVFAMLYWLAPGSVANARAGSFGDVFFFSMETLATVGYGDMYPATVYGRWIAGCEIVCGLAFTAILTGLTFVRFSRPRAKMVFAANPVVATYKGKPTLMVRVGNGRAGMLTDATAKLNVLLCDKTADGRLLHRAHELRLERAQIPAFPLSWTLMHVLDERSPLHGFDAARAIARAARIFVTVEASDPMLATTVQEIRNYTPRDIRFGMRYADAITTTPDDVLAVDLTRIGALEPDSGEDYIEQGWTEREEEPD
ncbi:inward rectifier potassium channel protein [Aliidongia dinghuensis]|uniref:Inward rectifier potassium channel protein n=1 Tax=Aliidongia dinghuensis TaxID=1867774 RepID=A0A8J2YPZ4_9PROT|nr:ion channel [Aliidongia dinghuensis]GGE98666.1 inward rectifier potassium channel protein [Aliidongia dinghuensis]